MCFVLFEYSRYVHKMWAVICNIHVQTKIQQSDCTYCIWNLRVLPVTRQYFNKIRVNLIKVYIWSHEGPQFKVSQVLQYRLAGALPICIPVCLACTDLANKVNACSL